MVTCDKLISLLHDIIDVLPTINYPEELANVFDSFIKILNMYVNQCMFYPKV